MPKALLEFCILNRSEDEGQPKRHHRHHQSRSRSVHHHQHTMLDLVHQQLLFHIGSQHLMKSNGYEMQPEREMRSEEHTSELQSRENLVCRPPLEKKTAPSSTRSQRSTSIV